MKWAGVIREIYNWKKIDPWILVSSYFFWKHKYDFLLLHNKSERLLF